MMATACAMPSPEREPHAGEAPPKLPSGHAPATRTRAGSSRHRNPSRRSNRSSSSIRRRKAVCGTSKRSLNTECLSPRREPPKNLPVDARPRAPGSNPPKTVEPKRATRAEMPDFRIIGVLQKLYVLMESKEGLVMMDQHAAHERVNFEKFRRALETGGVPCQRLLMPVTLQTTPRDSRPAAQNLAVAEPPRHRDRTLRAEHLQSGGPARLFEDR
jgi:DNA mismatch repair ATPase MutL